MPCCCMNAFASLGADFTIPHFSADLPEKSIEKNSPTSAIARIHVAKNGEAVKTQWPQGFWGESTAIMRIRVAKNGEATG